MSFALYFPPTGVLKRTSDLEAVRCIEPLVDARWESFVNAHPRASVFHSRAWLEALSRTYGYRPVAYTTSGADERLQDALVFCSVDSWLTGRRLVSLPFSDHCDPLVCGEGDQQILEDALEAAGRDGWRYIEIRPLVRPTLRSPLFQTSATYYFHELNLETGLDTIFRNFHKDSIQRKIRRAEREGLSYEEGTSEMFLDNFYHLLILTRRRHRLPPQPRKWFQNLVDCFGANLKIRIARKDELPVAAMLTLRHKDTLTYKYGCSDARFNRFGGIHLLYWKSIQDAKNSGLRRFDLGRTDFNQPGLVTFKDRWGATRSELTYFRYAMSGNPAHIFDRNEKNWSARMARQLLAHSHPNVLALIGSLLYRHVG